MTLEQRVVVQEMNNYELTVKSLYLAVETVTVGLEVYSSRMSSVPLFSIEIDVDRKGDASLASYELVAKRKAASLIRDIAGKMSVTA